MKKFIVIALALFLAVPAISFAGSATSRWDLSIGGTVKFDMGYADQNANSNYNSSRRKSEGANINDDYTHGNFFMTGSETGLNFFVRGPEAWGAKTSAFVAADFTGTWSGSNAGTFTMTIGKLQFDWPDASLALGVMPGLNGMFPTFAGNSLGYGNLNQLNKGFPNIPQAVYTKRFGKNWSTSLGVMQFFGPNGGGPAAASTNNNWTRAGYPGVEGAIQYMTDKCGKVGPWQLMVKLSGAYGRERHIVGGIAESYGDGYWTDLSILVPIIPEKQGNKTNALLFQANIFQGQNGGMNAPAPASSGNIGDLTVLAARPIMADVGGVLTQIGTTPGPAFNGAWTGSYMRGDGKWHAPVINGYYMHGQFYFTDKLFTNVFFGQVRAHMSNRLQANQGAIGVLNNQHLIANVMYDVNPAIRLGLEYANMHTRYANGFDLDTKGTLNAYRFGAYYFF